MQRRGPSTAAPRRRHPSRRLSRAQDRALGGGLFLLRESGPTGFLLREEAPAPRDFRVLLGNPHTCNCPEFQKRGELCKHICWILLKKFKLPRNHEYALQPGLVEGEIEELLRGLNRVPTPPKPASDPHTPTEGGGRTEQKEIGPEDICPICQEALLERKLPVTFCRFSCGNNVHIKCMKVLASYQDAGASSATVKCPLCREDFAPLNLLLEEFRNASQLVTRAERERLDRQLGLPCNGCLRCPIEGPCFKCAQCEEYHLCQACFDSRCHRAHAFSFREKRNQRWKSLEKRPGGAEKHRDVKNDVEEQTPQHPETPGQALTPKHVVRSLPLLMVTKNSKLLAPGLQCRLCLRPYCPGQYARLLPCSHKFHRKCIDSWLFHKSNACPVDGQVLYNPLLWKDTAVSGRGHHPAPDTEAAHPSKQEELGLFIPGTGLALPQSGAGGLPAIRQRDSEKPKTPPRCTDAQGEVPFGDPCSLSADDADPRKRIYECKIRQHFPRFFQDLPTGPCGKTPSQTFLPSITRKNNGRPPRTGRPRNGDAGQSRKPTAGSKHIHHHLKKVLGTRL
ncbi:E3 ubiquitin-protein ligase ZSWIM2 [Pipistrellus kuhlii]|uniref:RING-type E3 ubiquitin transferase n=1 Tax=Pipistrellus kuhlii TaxID=59472 RepID=A0A7J7QUD7_PIPKU|nr:E3 ubiquitin-protein ligase ZSWIM2 [Pipistrellus kuhlii]KAF6267518.1 zinc finger SWIM-type containing 2 [Pipistrellus kuhlii]